MEKYLLSIDNGLTATKAVLFHADGRQVAAALDRTAVINRGHFSELDMDRLWSGTASCIRSVMEKAEVKPSQLVAVGGSGHGAGLYLLDESLQPLGMAITSMDDRASSLVEKWRQEGVSAYDKTRHPVWAGQAVPLLRWIKLHEPERYLRIRKILSVKDWIKFKLTGRVTTEPTDASNSGLINLATRNYDSDILRVYGIEEMSQCLADLEESCRVIGQVTEEAAAQTGLLPGTPVTSGLFDVVACALGSGVYDRDRYSMIAGTWNINSGLEPEILDCGPDTKCSLFADSDHYIYVESSATSAVNFDWFIENVLFALSPAPKDRRDLYRDINQGVARIQPDRSDPFYLPFIHSSHLVKNIQAGFDGIRAEHTIFNLIRAIYEGVVFAHKMHIDHLAKGGILRDTAILSGGAANSSIWCQLFADVLGIRVKTTESSQAGALGAAVNAATAAGLYGNFKEAVASMVRDADLYLPSEQSELCQARFESFKDLLARLEK